MTDHVKYTFVVINYFSVGRVHTHIIMGTEPKWKWFLVQVRKEVQTTMMAIAERGTPKSQKRPQKAKQTRHQGKHNRDHTEICKEVVNAKLSTMDG